MPAIVVAQSSNRVIGRGGDLPWRLPSDMKRFREITIGGTVIMGRKTYESIPPKFRPLPKRRNIVLSTDPAYEADGAETFRDLESALVTGGEDSFVIGGGKIYEQALPLVGRVYLTLVEGDIDGDTLFPEMPESEWLLAKQSETLSENDHSFRFCVYDRR